MLSTHEYYRPYLTVGGDHIWKGTEFVLNPRGGDFDGIVLQQCIQPL